VARTPYHDISTTATPQSEPIPGTVPNAAGGHSFPVDRWTMLNRFLVLGTEGGTYYTSERKLTKDAAVKIMECIHEDGLRVVSTVVDISVNGRAPKQHPTMFVLAMCAGWEHDLTVRQAALDALPLVCRTGSHLLLFASYVEQFRGWGRSLRTAIGDWYMNRDLDDLCLQVAKYQSREGWSHRDLLRLSKPRPTVGSSKAKALGWAVNKVPGVEGTFLGAVDKLHDNGTTVDEAVQLIEQFRLPWEVVPSEMLTKPEIWHAMLPNLGLGALVRNLGRLTANGTIKPMSGAEVMVAERLVNERAVKGSRIHPLNVLTAAATYAEGHGFKGSLTWQPSGKVVNALGNTFSMAFDNVEPANKRTLVALDVSGSMDGSQIAGTFLSAREASSAMALVTLATEPQTAVMAFSGGFIPINLHAGMSLADVVNSTRRMPFDRTDCAQPMLWAIKHGVSVDTFVIYTDSETWAGSIHPVQALRQYRQRTGIPARCVVVGMCANQFSIADPSDAGMLDIVGFDSAAPSLIADFSAGRV
jgi:60 kDa SS-A/Ro ribonucleoprotein